MVKRTSTSKIITTIILTLVCMFSGCRKLDHEDRSKITITGNTLEGVDLNKTYEVDEGNYSEFSVNCKETFYGKTVLFLLEPAALIEIGLVSKSDDFPIPEGNYSLVSTSCVEGITVAFSTSGLLKSVIYSLWFTSGTMKVKDDNGTMDIDFDFTISPECGGGKLTGNFTGTMGQGTI